MSINAIIAVHPDVDVQFEDAQVMAALPMPTQQAIEQARATGRGFNNLPVSAVNYIVYNVYGSPDDLASAIEQFGAENIIPMGSWNMDGTRYGISRHFINQGTMEAPDIVETIEGTPSIPLHPSLMGVMPDDVTYDESGNEVSRQPASTFKQVILKCGQKPRRFE